MAGNADRPLLIAIIGILNILGGIFILVGGVLIAIGTLSLSDMSIDADIAATAIGGFVALIGIIYLLIGYGFWQGWKFIWYLALICWIISAVCGILAFPVGLVWTIITIILIWYLFRPNVKAFFGI